MAKFLRKALGLFVELPPEEEQADTAAPADAPAQTRPVKTQTSSGSTVNTNTYKAPSQQQGGYVMHDEDLEKFEAHFADVMHEANLPGPDYYEFVKMMETLENAVPDESTRMQAVFASLGVQGLTKDKLLDSAAKYKDVLDLDQQNFNNAISSKSGIDVDSKKQRANDLAKKMADNAALIQKLNKEITDAQIEIEKLKQDIGDAESKLDNNKRGYTLAYQAMVNKINLDVNNIKNTIK